MAGNTTTVSTISISISVDITSRFFLPRPRRLVLHMSFHHKDGGQHHHRILHIHMHQLRHHASFFQGPRWLVQHMSFHHKDGGQHHRHILHNHKHRLQHHASFFQDPRWLVLHMSFHHKDDERHHHRIHHSHKLQQSVYHVGIRRWYGLDKRCHHQDELRSLVHIQKALR